MHSINTISRVHLRIIRIIQIEAFRISHKIDESGEYQRIEAIDERVRSQFSS